ncbi:hypothetical protein [Zobellia roscoffensis]|uniref:hypothetical protein n=1 Tax=Zobellia roscoffensis TaxID=2779508 RepID=UPI00188B9AD2|nr:hypothetical protein [Zobellia roscoffensis]
MKNLLLPFFLLVTLSLFSQYQYPKKELADLVLKRTLAVQLLDEKSEFDIYANKAMKDIFEKNWKLTNVSFFSKEEIDKLKEANNSDYAYLTHNNEQLKETRMNHLSLDQQSGSFGRRYGMGANAPANSISYQRVAFTFAYYSYNLEVTNGGNSKSVTEIGFANGELIDIDYLFLCQQLTNLVTSASQDVPEKTYYNVQENIEKNQKSKLILPNDFFKEKDLKKMDSYYEYEHKLVDWDNYQKAILAKETGTTYVKIIWSHQHKMYLWIVVDAQTGSVTSQVGFGGIKFGKNHKANEIIKAKHLKYITSKMAQNVNNRYK